MRIKILTLTESERKELTSGFRTGESHCFRMRCRAILLKSDGLSSVRVGEQTEMTAQSVNGWVKRFELEGIKGLCTRSGQGRKPVMNCSDEDAVRRAIELDRQSVRAAKETWQKVSGKEARELTFRRFLSALVQDIDVFAYKTNKDIYQTSLWSEYGFYSKNTSARLDRPAFGHCEWRNCMRRSFVCFRQYFSVLLLRLEWQIQRSSGI